MFTLPEREIELVSLSLPSPLRGERIRFTVFTLSPEGGRIDCDCDLPSPLGGEGEGEG